jgi:hypothetical protein
VVQVIGEDVSGDQQQIDAVRLAKPEDLIEDAVLVHLARDAPPDVAVVQVRCMQ